MGGHEKYYTTKFRANPLTRRSSSSCLRKSHPGAAQRRKLRRLRAALRHEQQSIAMALASALHNSVDKTTRAQHNAQRGQKNAGTEYHELSDEDEVLARGSRPPCLGEPRGPPGSVAHRGADCRFRPSGADSGACGAVGGTVVAQCPSFLPRALSGGCRAGLDL